MTGTVNFSNHQWLVRSLDTNQNGKMEELRANSEIRATVDTDRNGELSQQEVVSALQADKVEIQQGELVRSRGFNIHVNGLETLKNVSATAANGVSNIHVWTPNFYSDDTSRDRYHKLTESNRAYNSGIDQMENSLRSIVSMTNGATDATSRALNIQAKTTLNSTQWKTWSARMQQSLSQTRPIFSDYKPGTPSQGGGVNNGSGHQKDPFANNGNSVGTQPHQKDPFANNGGTQQPHQKDPFADGHSGGGSVQPPVDPYEQQLQPHIREQEMILNNLQSSYEVMNNTLKAIREQTRDLPDLQQNAQATDRAISQAFSNIAAIEASPKSGQQVASNIRKEAEATEAKATGRTAPFAGIGAGVGAVAGAAIGYFAGGKSTKNALIGAGIGAAVGGGGGALIGNGIDSGYKNTATSLRDLAGRVETYNVASDKQQAIKANQSLYGQLQNARDAHDLDRARVVNNDLKAIGGQIAPVNNRTTEILEAHRKY